MTLFVAVTGPLFQVRIFNVSDVQTETLEAASCDWTIFVEQVINRSGFAVNCILHLPALTLINMWIAVRCQGFAATEAQGGLQYHPVCPREDP